MRSRRNRLYFAGTNSRHVIFKKNGNLYGYGFNNNGALGLGHRRSVNTPTKLTFPNSTERVIKVACGWNHTIIVTNKSTYATGYNLGGECGIGTFNSTSTFKKVKFNEKRTVNDVFCGYSSSFFFTSFNILSCGCNTTGCLGIGSTSNKNIPTTVIFDVSNVGKSFVITDIKNAVCGEGFTVFLSKFGVLYKTGVFARHRKKTTMSSVPKTVDFFKNCKIIAHASGYQHYLCYTNNNELYSIGYNSGGQLGIGNTYNQDTFQKVKFDFKGGRIVSLSCCWYSSFFVLDNGSLYSFGKNSYGQLGRKKNFNNSIPIQVSKNIGNYVEEVFGSADHVSVFLSNCECAYVTGNNNYGGLGITFNEQQHFFRKNANVCPDIVKSGIENENFIEKLVELRRKTYYVDCVVCTF